MIGRRPLGALLPTALMAVALPAQAHLVNTGLGPFYDGLSHFALAPEDWLPVLALALLVGLNGAAAGRVALFALPAAWFAAGVAGLAWPVTDTSPLWATVPLLLLGVLVATNLRLRSGWALALAIGIGVPHGFFNGAALAASRLGLTGLSGIALALFVVMALASAAVVALRAPWARMVVRVGGSWVAAAGLLMLARSIRAA